MHDQDAGRVPTCLGALPHLAPGPLLAGPSTLVRSLKTQRVVGTVHPRYERFLAWTFAVSPDHRRRGLGRMLMGQALAQADAAGVPAYLPTGNPDNLPYYRSYGFDVLRETPIAGGVPNWFMQRPAAVAAVPSSSGSGSGASSTGSSCTRSSSGTTCSPGTDAPRGSPCWPARCWRCARGSGASWRPRHALRHAEAALHREAAVAAPVPAQSAR
jgi:hypothetical protein